MAERKANETMVEEAVEKEKRYTIRVTDNAAYCGVGAGGVQFANGKAVISNERMARWFEEHDGYTVETM